MTKYRKKQEVIDAIKWTGENRQQLSVFAQGKDIGYLMDMSVIIKTLEGNIKADMGDWIARRADGELYRCKSQPIQGGIPDAPA